MRSDAVAQPFDQLLRLSEARQATPVRGAQACPDGGPLRLLLCLLDCHGPMRTTELADAAELSTKAVWGLLKAPRARGQVEFENGLWEQNADYLGPDVRQVVELLRGLGWTCQPPR